MSTIVGNVVLSAQDTHPEIPGHVIASALSVVCGGVVCAIGLAKMGWLVDFISLTAISAFMTGSAITIAVGQIPTMMGISGFSTRDPPYLVFIHTLEGLPRTSIDAALGLTALALLYMIRSMFTYLAMKQPHRRKIWFFCQTLRTVFIILLYTLIGWVCNLDLNGQNQDQSPFRILGQVPRGFQHAAVPTVNADIISTFADQLPASIIVLLIEHISIAKSFGRVNNYTIDPSQELVAIGVSNLLGPFLGGYPATGSFSRTAIKSKAGVRTPFAGVITAVVVLLAIYALPAVFFYIPNAALSAVIIHAVGDLITPPNTVYQFWRISPFEVFIFFAGVIVTVFTSIETGIYVVIAVSAALLLFRVFKAKGRFLGRVKVHSVIGDHLIDSDDQLNMMNKNKTQQNTSSRNIFLPIDHHDGSNPQVQAQHPYPGIFIYRFSEGYNYPNANHYLDYMVEVIFKETRRTDREAYKKRGDRPWNDPGPRRGAPAMVEDDRPTLKAIILDFSSVNNVDITSVQHLIDVRNQLDKYAAPHTVQWHIACINNRWTKRALAAAGFGYPTAEAEEGFHRWKPIFSVAELGGASSAAEAAEDALNRQRTRDVESGRIRSSHGAQDSVARKDFTEDDDINLAIKSSLAYRPAPNTKVAVVQGLNRPLFHLDLTSALQSAIHNVEELEALHRREESERKEDESNSSE